MKTASYADRVNKANTQITELEANPDFDPTSFLSKAGKFVGFGSNAFLSEERQIYEAQKKDFISSALLGASGGSRVNPDEYKRAESKYFPAVGDTKKVIEQKKILRDRTAKNLINQSKGVYQAQEALGQFDLPKSEEKTDEHQNSNSQESGATTGRPHVDYLLGLIG